MPIFRETKEFVSDHLNNLQKTTTRLFIFDHLEAGGKGVKARKQMICVDSCITLGTKTLKAIDDQEQINRAFTVGQIYDGYFIKTLNGPYNYCYKIWTDRRLPFAPLNARIPHEDEPQDAMIIDRNEDLVGIACGPHLAYCSIKSLEIAGYSIDGKPLPIVGLRVKLRKQIENRPSAIPYAAFHAIPIVEEFKATVDVAP